MTGGEFRRVSTRQLWHDGRMRDLRRRSPDAHDLLLYLITSPFSNFIGLYLIAPSHIAQDLGWKQARVSRALRVLTKAEFIGYDNVAAVVYVPFILEWHPLSTKAQAQGAVRRLSDIPRTSLLTRLRQVLLAREDLVDGHRNGLRREPTISLG